MASTDIRTLQPAPLADGLLRATSAAPYGPGRPAPQAAAPQAAPMGPLQPAPPPRPYASQAFVPQTPLPATAPAPPGAAQGLGSDQGVGATLPTSLHDNTPNRTGRPTPLAGEADPTGAVGARYYSVHRGLGVEPDPIPMAQDGVGSASGAGAGAGVGR